MHQQFLDKQLTAFIRYILHFPADIREYVDVNEKIGSYSASAEQIECQLTTSGIKQEFRQNNQYSRKSNCDIKLNPLPPTEIAPSYENTRQG